MDEPVFEYDLNEPIRQDLIDIQQDTPVLYIGEFSSMSLSRTGNGKETKQKWKVYGRAHFSKNDVYSLNQIIPRPHTANEVRELMTKSKGSDWEMTKIYALDTGIDRMVQLFPRPEEDNYISLLQQEGFVYGKVLHPTFLKIIFNPLDKKLEEMLTYAQLID